MGISKAVAQLAAWLTAYLVNEPGCISHEAASPALGVISMCVMNTSMKEVG